MMFDTLIFLAAAATPAPSASDAAACGQATIETSPAVNPAVLEMTYNAFVAVEETPGLSALLRPAVRATQTRKPAIAFPTGTAWIS